MVEETEKNTKEEEKDIFKEINEMFTDVSRSSGFSKYQRQMQSIGHVPNNQFDHQWGLIHAPKRDAEQDEFHLLEDQNKYLGNIKDEKMLRFYQNDNFFLTHMFAMAKNDPAEKKVFEVLWANFKSELRMTCNLDGEERKLQSGLPVGISKGQKKGFGILGRNKKKNVVDYVTPPDEEQSSNY